jgi:hypothetical protein
MVMTRKVRLLLILLASGFSILWGFSIGQKSNGWADFRGVYYGSRCLLQHHNPYNVSELEDVYRTDGGEGPSEPISARPSVTHYVNLPTTLLIIAPFAILPWGFAHLLWMILTAGAIIFAALLMWNCGANYAPVISGGLICTVLINCEAIFGTGNTAGIVVGLCVVAVWCFFQERFVSAGILCLAVSLAIKPHDAGLVWLYFLLAGGAYRKRALQALIVAVVLSLFAILWVWHVAPHWIQELQSNLLAYSAPGGANNPGPIAVNSGSGPSMIINLQSVISTFRDDPHIYNPVSYMICGMLLLVWSARTLKSQFSQSRAWLALASVTAITMLVTYHRPYDAKLLLLAVPACAMLWAEGGPIGWVALLVTTAGIVSTGDIPLAILLILTKNLLISTAGLSGKMLTVVLMRPAPLILLAMGIFYLWVYVRRDPVRAVTVESGEPKGTPHALTPA